LKVKNSAQNYVFSLYIVYIYSIDAIETNKHVYIFS